MGSDRDETYGCWRGPAHNKPAVLLPGLPYHPGEPRTIVIGSDAGFLARWAGNREESISTRNGGLDGFLVPV